MIQTKYQIPNANYYFNPRRSKSGYLLHFAIFITHLDEYVINTWVFMVIFHLILKNDYQIRSEYALCHTNTNELMANKPMNHGRGEIARNFFVFFDFSLL
jgi:hypothetical protein